MNDLIFSYKLQLSDEHLDVIGAIYVESQVNKILSEMKQLHVFHNVQS